MKSSKSLPLELEGLQVGGGAIGSSHLTTSALSPAELPLWSSTSPERLHLSLTCRSREAKALGELFALLRCGPPLAFEHRAANPPQPIELLLQFAVCPGRQRLVDSV